MPEERLVEFNEFYASAGESVCAMLIMLSNERRSGEQRRTKGSEQSRRETVA